MVYETIINGKTVFVEQDNYGIDIAYHTRHFLTVINGINTVVVQDDQGIDVAYLDR